MDNSNTNVISLHPVYSPTLYDHAKQALAECYSIDECKLWSDRAAAIREYAKQRDDEELLKLAHKIRGRAIGRMGELLEQMEPNSGARTDLQPKGAGSPRLTRKQIAADAGLSPDQAKQALRVARVPEDRREELLEQGAPITALAKEGTLSKPKPLIDLEGIPPEQFNKGIHLFGSIDQANRELEALGDLVHAFGGMLPNDRRVFIEILEVLRVRLEILKNAIT